MESSYNGSHLWGCLCLGIFPPKRQPKGMAQSLHSPVTPAAYVTLLELDNPILQVQGLRWQGTSDTPILTSFS